MINYPIMQAFTFNLFFCPILAYHLTMSPYIDLIVNIIMDINECALMVLGAFFFTFAEPSNNSKRLNILGYAAIGVILFIFMLNITVLWVLKLISLWKEVKVL